MFTPRMAMRSSQSIIIIDNFKTNYGLYNVNKSTIFAELEHVQNLKFIIQNLFDFNSNASGEM